MNAFFDRPVLRCAPGDRIAAHSTYREKLVFPRVEGVVVEVLARSNLVLLEGHGAWCFLRGAVKVKA